MAKIVETTALTIYPMDSRGVRHPIYAACDHYDDGGMVCRSTARTRGGNYLRFAQVGPNNDYTLKPDELKEWTNAGAFNFTTEEMEYYLYTTATTNSGSGGVFNEHRAQWIRDNTGPGKTFTAEQVEDLGLAGVPGMPGDKRLPGQISTAAVGANGATKWKKIATTTTTTSAGITTISQVPGVTPSGPYEPPPMAKGRQVDGERAILRYPLLAPPDALGYDYIKITAYKYQPPGLNLVNKTGVDYGGGIVEGERFETVILPMQPNITESNSTSWNEDQMNAIEGAMGTIAAGLIDSLGDAFTGKWTKAGGKIAGTFDNIAKQVDSVMTDPATKPGIIAHFAGQAIGKNIMGRQTGQVLNPNMELLFNGPRLRTFNFNFTFTPRFKEEAQIIRKIIRAFKRNMAPQRSTSNLFLLSPRVFKLKYIYNNRAKEDDDGDGSQHPYMDTFKTCALTAFNVDYTPGGSYATYNDGGSMTQYKVTMSFNELNPIYADEYKLSTQHMGYG